MSRPAFALDKSLTLQAQFDAALVFIAAQAGDLTAADQLLGETNGKLTVSEARVVELTAANTGLNDRLTAADAAKVTAETAKATAEKAVTDFKTAVDVRALEIVASQGGVPARLGAPGAPGAADTDSIEGITASLATETDPAKRYTLAKKLGALRAKAKK